MLHRRDMGRKTSTFKKNKVKATLDKCRETGKISYPNEKQANQDKIKMWSSSSMTIEELNDLHVYDCEHCKMKHIGHKKYFNQSQGLKTDD